MADHQQFLYTYRFGRTHNNRLRGVYLEGGGADQGLALSFPEDFMFSIALRHAEHTRQYCVSPSKTFGWDFILSEDLTPTHHAHFDDWHRVERAIAMLELEIKDLTANGWRVV